MRRATRTSARRAWSRVRLSVYVPSKQVKRTRLGRRGGPRRRPGAGTGARPRRGCGGPATRDALDVADHAGLGQGPEVGEGVRRRPVDQAVHGEAVAPGVLARDGGGDRVVAEAAAVGEQAGQAGGVPVGALAEEGLQPALQRGRGDHAERPQAEGAEEDTAADRGAPLFGGARRSHPLGTSGLSGSRSHSNTRDPGGTRDRGCSSGFRNHFLRDAERSPARGPAPPCRAGTPRCRARSGRASRGRGSAGPGPRTTPATGREADDAGQHPAQGGVGAGADQHLEVLDRVAGDHQQGDARQPGGDQPPGLGAGGAAADEEDDRRRRRPPPSARSRRGRRCCRTR